MVQTMAQNRYWNGRTCGNGPLIRCRFHFSPTYRCRKRPRWLPLERLLSKHPIDSTTLKSARKESARWNRKAKSASKSIRATLTNSPIVKPNAESCRNSWSCSPCPIEIDERRARRLCEVWIDPPENQRGRQVPKCTQRMTCISTADDANFVSGSREWITRQGEPGDCDATQRNSLR